MAVRSSLLFVLLSAIVISSSSTSAVSTSRLLGYDCVKPNAAASSLPALTHDRPVLCGEHTQLVLSAAIPVPPNMTLVSSARPPVTLTPKSTYCTLASTGQGAGAATPLRLPVVSARLEGISANQWVLSTALSFPDDADEDDDLAWTQTTTSLACAFRMATVVSDLNVDVALSPLTFLASDFEVSGVTLLNKPVTASDVAASAVATVAPTKPVSGVPGATRQLAAIATPLLGIGQTAYFRLEVSGENAAARVDSLSGSCVVNGANVTVSAGRFNYSVQQNDSDLIGLRYACALVDGAGNAPTKAKGEIKHMVLQMDGSVPRIEDDIFMLVATDKPARIGSTISLTLKAENLTQGYSGLCDVNGVKGVPLLEAEDHGFYMVQYTVAEGDTSLDESAAMPLSCVVRNRAGNTFLFKYNVDLGFGIDAIRPRVKSTVLLFSSDRPAHEATIIEIQVAFENDEPNLRVANNETCRVNNVSVGSSFSKSSSRAFLITYVVGKGEAMWKAGALPIHCVVQDAAGNTAVIDHFTDGNTLLARELKPIEMDADAVISTEFLPDRLLVISFVIVALASHSISKVCPHVGLPRITGYIVTGILVGPYVLNFLSTHQIRKLRIIDELSMAYIGLTAGSKLHWNHMQPIMKSILAVTVGLTLVEYIIGTLTITVLAGYIDFLQDTTESEKYAIALLAGCMMIARSPSSALAVIEETKSQGHFTTLIFAVTVMCDVLVIFLFNVNSMITESFLSEKTMSSDDLLRLVLQLCGSTLMGMVLGKLMGWIVFWRPRFIKRKSVWFKCQQIVKQFLILLYGWMIFVICHLAHPYLEPLLCCMVSGAIMWNTSSNPEELGVLLKNLADLVYVCFFTITGATLELDMLGKAMALSLVLTLTRVVGIFLGSFVGGVVAGEDRGHCKVAWMAYITQAGVTLGLAKQIQLMYPGWGSYFSTMIVAVVICNQLLGPPLLRFVLRYVGDAKKKEIGKVDGLTALVFTGADTQNATSAILRLEMCGWNVHSLEVQSSLEVKKEKAYVEAVTKDVHDLIQAVKPIEVVVVMMPTDQENYEVIRAIMNACQKLRRLSVLRVVVQVAGNSSGSSHPTGRSSIMTTTTVDDEEDETRWAAKFADMPVVLEFGDTIDVIVVDRVEATDMLIELAACGKVVNITEKQPTTAIAMEDSEAEGEAEGETDLESDMGNGRVPSRVRLRQKLKHTVRRMMLV